MSLILFNCYLAFLAKAKLVINPYNIHVLYNLVYRIGMFIIWKRRILLFLNKLVGFFLTMLMLLCLHLVYFVVVIVDWWAWVLLLCQMTLWGRVPSHACPCRWLRHTPARSQRRSCVCCGLFTPATAGTPTSTPTSPASSSTSETWWWRKSVHHR